MRKLLAVYAVLVAATLVFRLPALINARDVNSDSAVVALQAMHLLHGEWSWFVWGAGYQAAVEPAIVAAAFAIFGASPLVLMLTSVLGYLVALLLGLQVLHRRLGAWPALLCALPIVITPWALSWAVLCPPRMWSITLVFLAIWLLAGAAESKWPLQRYALAPLCLCIAMLMDLLSAVYVPGVILFAALCAVGASWRSRTAAIAGGLILGLALILLSRSSAESSTSQASISLERISANAVLLREKCLPFTLGYALYRDSEFPYERTLRSLPMPWVLLQFLGGWSLIVGIVAGGALATGRIAPPLRRLALLGIVTAGATIAAFLLSVMPADMWAVRYLSPMLWMSPFALAPLADRLGARRFGLALAPYLVVALVGGWTSYGFWVRGPLPRLSDAGAAREEQQLIDFLRSRGIRYGATDYWLAYRVTFLAREDPILVPLDASADRYLPYREQYIAAPVTALVFHPAWSRQPRASFESYLQSNRIPYETVEVGRFTVLIVARRDPGLV